MGAQESMRSATDPREQLQFTKNENWYGCFLAQTDQKSVQREVLTQTLQAQYPELWRRIGDSRYDLSMLLAGAGPGESEVAFTSDVKNRRNGLIRVSLHYEDVSPEMYREFRIKAQALDITDAVVSHSMQKFEDPTYFPPDADLTLGFQMWYYVNGWGKEVPDVENSLMKFAKTVSKKDGVAVLSVQSSLGDLLAVREKWLQKFHGHDDLTAEAIKEELKRLNLEYLAIPRAARTDVSPLFQDGRFNPTNEGKQMLSFMIRKYWEDLTQEEQAQVANDVQNLVEKNGEEVLMFRDIYFFIPGNQPSLAA